MQPSTQTVLCVVLRPETKVADEAIAECLELLRRTAQSLGAIIVKSTADRLIMTFRTPDAAAGAAARLHAAVDAQFAARIAFHCARTSGGLDDPAVRLVLRLLARARDGETLTSRETAALLGTSFRAFSRRLQASPLRRQGARGAYGIKVSGK